MAYVLRLHLPQVNGEVEIPFDTVEGLKSSLKSIDWQDLMDIIAANSGTVAVVTGAPPRPELDGICSLGAGGLPRFSKVPKSDGEYVGATLFAVEPKHLSPGQIETSTWVGRGTSNILSHAHWKKHFLRDSEGMYCLSTEGKRWIIDTVLPKLKP